MIDPKKILFLAAYFLDEYSDRLGYDGSNDWAWPKSWTKEDKKEFINLYHNANGTYHEEEHGDDLKTLHAPPNFSVAFTLAAILRGDIDALDEEHKKE